MSKPAGIQSYLSPTLAELMKLYQPNERIDVRRVSLEKKILEQAMTNFSAPQTKETPPEPSFSVESFDEPEDNK